MENTLKSNVFSRALKTYKWIAYTIEFYVAFWVKCTLNLFRAVVKEYEVNFPPEWIWLFLFSSLTISLSIALLKNSISTSMVQVPAEVG